MVRVLLLADMEGIARISHPNECWPVHSEYWEVGRLKMTADVVAACLGLLEGGATNVVVHDGHGLGDWSNLIPELLPPCASLLDRSAPETDFDAAFQVGYHARCGTADGFISHTNVPEFRIRVNGMLITESHEDAWAVGVPLLGVVGDAALERQLDGSLSETSFLAVKQSSSRTETTPIWTEATAAANRIQAFARECIEKGLRARPKLPSPIRVEISMNPALIDGLDARSGIRRVSESVLFLEGSDWNREITPALNIARAAAAGPLVNLCDGLDLSSERAMTSAAASELRPVQIYFDNWMRTNYREWQD